MDFKQVFLIYLSGIGRFLLSFLVAPLPAAFKRKYLQSYDTDMANILSALVELAVFTGLFFRGFIRFVTFFTDTAGYDYMTYKDEYSVHEVMGIGTTGFIGYLFQPLTWVILFFFFEGMLRAIDTAYTERRMGTAPLNLLWNGTLWINRMNKKQRLLKQLGPERPDRVILPEESLSGMLEIYTCREKPWSEVQVLKGNDFFFLLQDKELVRDGDHFWFRYQMRPMEAGEIIRGSIVHYALSVEE